MNDLSEKTAIRFFGVVLIFAAVFRIWGIWHGYPYSFYPDEAHFVKRSLSFGSGSLNPNWFHKPAFFMYLLFFEYGLLFIAGKLMGLWATVGDFAVFYIKNPGPFYIIGRITVTIFSLGIIWMTYLVAERMFSRKTGILAALMLAISPGHVMVAKDIKADVPCAFFTMVSLYFLLRFIGKNDSRHFFTSSAFAGIGTATKIYSIVMLVPLFFAELTRNRDWRLNSILLKAKNFGLCILLLYFVFFIFSPYNFLDSRGREATFGSFIHLSARISDVLTGDNHGEQEEPLNIARDIYKPEVSFSLYWEGIKEYLSFLSKGLGNPFVLILSLSGLLYILIFQRNRMVLHFLMFPFIFAFTSIFLHPGYAEIRHQVVLYPFLVIPGAVLFVLILDKLAVRQRWAYALAILLLIPVIGVVQYNIYLTHPDTRNLAKKWIEENIPADSKLLVNENGPVLHQKAEELKQVLEKAKQAAPDGQFTAAYDTYLEHQIAAVKNVITYDIDEIRFPWWLHSEEQQGVHELTSEFHSDMGNPLKPVGVNTYDYYVDKNFDYVVVHSGKYGPFFNKGSDISKRFPSFTAFYHTLFEKGVLVKEFSPEETGGPGPVVKIFKINQPHHVMQEKISGSLLLM